MFEFIKLCLCVCEARTQWEEQHSLLRSVYISPIKIEFSVGIVIVFMTIVFTWMPADFSITFAQNHCFGVCVFLDFFFTDSTYFFTSVYFKLCAWVCILYDECYLSKTCQRLFLYIEALIYSYFKNRLRFIFMNFLTFITAQLITWMNSNPHTHIYTFYKVWSSNKMKW